MISNLKIEYCNIPISIPVEWKADLQEKADELGISRNSATQLAIKLGAPLLEAHIRLMRKTLKENMRRISKGKCSSKILGTTPLTFAHVKPRANERRK